MIPVQNYGFPFKVYGPTEWVSPMVVQPKKNTGEIRICVDMRLPNKAIKRTRHVIPTIEEIRHMLNGANVFSKVDLTNGYHQLELHPSSRDITTFITHKGLRRYNRLNFGTCSASEIFNEEIRKNISDISRVINIHDDILVFGKNKIDHDNALYKLLDILKEIGITANKKKCIFGTKCIDFFGMRFSEGYGAGPEKS